MVPIVEESAATKLARQRGRRIGSVLFALMITSFTLVCAAQIVQQAWAMNGNVQAPSCRATIQGMLHALTRARRVAAEETGPERVALERFRAALQPQWSFRPGLARACKADPEAMRALGQIDRLRYAEEHAVRYESVDLARRRRDVLALGQRLRRTEPASPSAEGPIQP